MRPAILLMSLGVLAFGCRLQPSTGGDDYNPPSYPDADYDVGCHADTDCPGEVCARTHECLPAALVRSVRVSWTLTGSPASAATCASSPDLDIEFFAGTESHGYAPVPCAAGVFSIDKLPTRFSTASLGLEGSAGYSGDLDDAGATTIDLPY